MAGSAGRPAWHPRLLVSVWVYAYSEGIGSAWEIARLAQYEPGLQWLCGMAEINHHTLSDFRVEHKTALDELFAEMLALLEKEELLSLERVTAELKKIQAEQKPAERAEARVSLSEPEARLMKHGDSAIEPSYNVQIGTEAKQKAIVGVHLSQSSSDAASLLEAVRQIESNLGRKPKQMVVDGGFTNRSSIKAMAEEEIDLIGSMWDPRERSAAAMKALGIDVAYAPERFVWDAESNTLRCPAGQCLQYARQSRKRENLYRQYQAEAAVCAVCPHRAKCCPHAKQGRTVSRLEAEPEQVVAMRRKMETEAAKTIYHRREEVAEFSNTWIKDKLKLRKFHVRGLAKAAIEAIWACLPYNVMLWIRTSWRKSLAPAA